MCSSMNAVSFFCRSFAFWENSNDMGLPRSLCEIRLLRAGVNCRDQEALSNQHSAFSPRSIVVLGRHSRQPGYRHWRILLDIQTALEVASQFFLRFSAFSQCNRISSF